MAASVQLQIETVDRRLFRAACSRFATGVTVATVNDPKSGPKGLTVNSFTSVSCSPPLVLICLDHACSVLPAFRSAGYFGISVLGQHQQDTAVRFSTRGVDRFGSTRWHSGPNGAPLITGSLAAIECSLRSVIDEGDHAILIGETVSVEMTDGEPLVYFASGFREIAGGADRSGEAAVA
jgi:flavin reductase (DIM6/NTAB) family NADH-FMN oxidoreductase RutF